MSQIIAPEVQSLWNELVQAQSAYHSAFQKFLSSPQGRVELLRAALRGPERSTALTLAKALTQEEKTALFPEWFFLASWGHGGIQTARDALLSLG